MVLSGFNSFTELSLCQMLTKQDDLAALHVYYDTISGELYFVDINKNREFIIKKINIKTGKTDQLFSFNDLYDLDIVKASNDSIIVFYEKSDWKKQTRVPTIELRVRVRGKYESRLVRQLPKNYRSIVKVTPSFIYELLFKQNRGGAQRLLKASHDSTKFDTLFLFKPNEFIIDYDVSFFNDHIFCLTRNNNGITANVVSAKDKNILSSITLGCTDIDNLHCTTISDNLVVIWWWQNNQTRIKLWDIKIYKLIDFCVLPEGYILNDLAFNPTVNKLIASISYPVSETGQLTNVDETISIDVGPSLSADIFLIDKKVQ